MDILLCMTKSKYQRLIKAHYYLRTLPEWEARYRPYYDLARKLEEAIVYFLQQNQTFVMANKFKFSSKIEDYIFLKGHQVLESSKMGYLINVISHINQEAFLFAENTLRDFWIRARVYHLKNEEPKISNDTNLPLLDSLSIACGYSGFNEFLLKHYKGFPSGLKILVLPFMEMEGLSPAVETLLNKRLDTLAEKNQLKIRVELKGSGTDPEKQRYFTPESARKEGEREGADLVIFGHILHQQMDRPKITLQYAIVDPAQNVGVFPEKEDGRIFEYTELATGLVPNELDAIVYWCLGIKEFLNSNYEQAIRLFLKIPTETERQKEDIYFRIAVIYDWLEKDNLAIHYYALALETGGIISSFKQLSNWTRSGDLVERDKVGDPEKFKNKEIKMLLFEIARIQHALLLKKNGPHPQARKYLEQAVEFIQQSWLESAYSELIANAYCSLAQLCKTPTINGRIKNPGQAIAHYFAAIKLSRESSIHQSAADFFLRYNYLETAVEMIKDHHGEETELLVYYMDKLKNK